MTKRKRDSDDLKLLSELARGDERINVIAVAYSTTPPTATKGSQHCVKFELVDNTTTDIITCTLFEELELLPDVSTFSISHPMIVRLRRFTVQMFQDRVQLDKSPGHSWSIFSKDSTSFRPHAKSHENTAASLTTEEKDRITDLRDWLSSEQFNSTVFQKCPTFDPADFAPRSSSNPVQQTEKSNKFVNGLITFADLEYGLYFDTVAQVIGLRRNPECSILRCVDGTISPLTTFKTNSLYFETHLTQIQMAQLFDYYLDIAVYDSHNIVADGVKVGDFVEFTNLHCYVPSSNNVHEVILHKGINFNRGMRILQLDHSSVAPVQQRLDQIKVSCFTDWTLPAPPPYNPDSPPSTQLSYPDLPLTSIIDILQSSVPRTVYRVRVFVDSYTPDNYPSFVSPFCEACHVFSTSRDQCGKCGSQSLTSDLLFSLQVRDYHDAFECEVKCFAASAREFLRMGEGSKLSMGELEEVETVVGKWCDLHVFCVERSEGRRSSLVLTGCVIVDHISHAQYTPQIT